ncbi:hypothetical protein ACFXOY_11370 [Streptomyces niveus]|uniref:hypothetical protein n=1 Tax=Streptomyces niveus TaxID=193462 RepID=UPI0036CE71E4
MSTSIFSTPSPCPPAQEGPRQWPGPEQSRALAAVGEAGLRAAGWLRDLVGRGEPRCLLNLAGDVAQALTGLDPYDHDTPERDGGDSPVFLGWAEVAATGDEGAVRFERIDGVDG